jgi:hypothetical protein
MSLSNIKGLRTADPEKVQCRYCENAIKGGICKGTCKVFDDIENNRKPDEVYFDNAPCPKFIKGEDLIKYEVEI